MTPTAPSTATATPGIDPAAPPFALAFITGCGRSGTTILGRVLGVHPDITYFNDRFDLWLAPFPVADAWSLRDQLVGPAARALPPARVALTAQDAEDAGEPARRDFFARLDAERAGRPCVVEKLALNNFRLPFLRRLAPTARFINIVRHGVEVARSIEVRARAGEWYGVNDRKWALLAQHAHAVGLGHLADACATPFDRGLLEWRLSVEAAEAYWAAARGVPVHHLRYEQLLADPAGAAQRLFAFLGLDAHPNVLDFARAEVARRSPEARGLPIPPSAATIAGPTLARLGYAL